jgi:restriction endonuclease S subunit
MEYFKVEDCCEILDSQRIPITGRDRVVGEYPYYGANGIQGYVDDYIFDDDLVLVAEDGGHFGSKTKPIAYKVSGKCWVNNHAHVLKAKDVVDTDYLCYSLMFYDVEKIVNGATRQKLNQKQLRQILVPKRSKSNQLEIVKQLKTVQGIIDNKTTQLSEYDQLIKSRFVEVFVDKYEKIKVSTKLKTTSGGTPKSDQSEYYTNGTIPWLTSGEVNQGRIEKTEKFITEKGLENSSAKWIPKKSIVIAMYGATAGKVGIIEIPATTNQAVCAVLPHDEYNPEYLRFAFEYISDELAGKAVGGGQPNISQAIIKESLIFNPPLEVQNKFSTFVQQVDKLKFEDNFLQYKD